MEFLEIVINKFPVDSLFYAIVKNNVNEWIVYNKVFAYRIEDADIYLVVRDDNSVYTYNVKNCYKTKKEAEKHLTQQPETVRVAVDGNGRLIKYAMFDDDRVVDVPTNYKTHVGHCCLIHGCKYGDDDCPVANKKILQEYLCEECFDDSDDSTMWKKIRKAFKET